MPRCEQLRLRACVAGRVLCVNFISMRKLLVPRAGRLADSRYRRNVHGDLLGGECAMLMSDAFAAAIWVGLATVALLPVLILHLS